MILPMFGVFFMLKWTQDAATTILAVTTFCYSFCCWLYDKVIADFKWSWFVGKETTNCCSKLFDGIGFTLLFGVITATFLILVSMFFSWGMGNKMVLPLPHFGNGWDTVYLIFVIILYLVVLPMGEEAFYRVFQGNQWKGMLADTLVSVFYAGMNLAAHYWIFDSWSARWVFTGLTFFVSMILVLIRDKTNVVYSLMARVGVAVGVLAWIFFLYQTVQHAMPREQPTYFFRANVENYLTKWFSK